MLKKLFFFCLISLVGATHISAIAEDSTLTYVFSHGLGAYGECAMYYVKGHRLNNIPVLDERTGQVTYQSLTSDKNNPFYILYHPISFFNYPSSNANFHDDGNISAKNTLSSKKASLAQGIEIETLKNHIKNIDGNVVLFGHSMGASTIINYMAQYNPKNVKAVVLEAPFDTIEHVIRNKIGWLRKLGLGSLYLSLAHPEYDKYGIRPGNVAHRIHPTVPVIFIHSKKDSLIPVTSSRRMYNAMKKNGHAKVHIFELEEATHTNASNCTDSANYQRVVHAFYKNYGLPCDETLAAEGQALFETTQPAIY